MVGAPIGRRDTAARSRWPRRHARTRGHAGADLDRWAGRAGGGGVGVTGGGPAGLRRPLWDGPGYGPGVARLAGASRIRPGGASAGPVPAAYRSESADHG
ncbi:hypothetical protein D0T12_31295 [Actinomadura spongiicola]|uniref:Uncharacterized protein n=1 Tax=Actinomadura spongiicola TaxID=2303421 RepID=A0A372G8H6_9ACTN|nr:hypothetical protein D0T12_31295 [Actinomadura spongiicola]